MACCLVEASASFLPTNATGLCCRKLKAGGGGGEGGLHGKKGSLAQKGPLQPTALAGFV